jgi:hypothetical protein
MLDDKALLERAKKYADSHKASTNGGFLHLAQVEAHFDGAKDALMLMVNLSSAKEKALEDRVAQLEYELAQIAGLILTTGFTELDNGNRVMDANEYKWIDAACELLRPHHKPPKKPTTSF